MKKNYSTQKLTGWKMLVVALMLMMAVANVSAQRHGPPPPPPNVDSILHAAIDSFLAHHPADTIPTPPPPPPFPGYHRDTIVFHRDTAFRPFPDSIPFGHVCHRDSTGGGGHDSIPTPPLPPDTTWGGGGHDSIPTPPLPPDSGWGGWIDTIPTPPCPPLPPDTIPPHHKDLLMGNDNSTASISIFPNPVVNTSTMRIANASNTVTFRLYDMNGQIAREMINLGNGDMNFIKGNLTPGVYIYEMIDGNTIASTGKVIVQ